MIPEDGNSKEFKQAVLREVDFLWCLCCGLRTVYDPAQVKLHFCADCTVKKKISFVPLGERTAYTINVADMSDDRVKLLLDKWKKALRR